MNGCPQKIIEGAKRRGAAGAENETRIYEEWGIKQYGISSLALCFRLVPITFICDFICGH